MPTFTGLLTVLVAAAGLRSATPPAEPASPPAAPAAEPAKAAGLEGAWNGAVQVPGMELKIGVKFSRAGGEGGGLRGTIDVPDQGAIGIPLDAVTVEGDAVSFRLAGVPGEPTFRGTLAGDVISGTFSQGDSSLPFELKRGELARERRPQDPVPPFPYTTEELTARHGDVTLAGTLTRPEGDGPFPAVVLISGSGQQNRDEEIFNHRPFAVLADHLTRAGIAVLRYDDRGVGGSTGEVEGASSADFAEDAEAWVRLLDARKDVGDIGLLGHSEGGAIAPMIAARNDTVKFIVTLAGPAVPGSEILAEQNRALLVAAGAPQEWGDASAKAARELFAAVAGDADPAAVREKMIALAKAQSGGMAEPPAEQVDAQLERLRKPWMVYFLSHDPATDLRRVKVPVLALLGGKDAQVVATQNGPAAEAALKEAGNKDATVKVFPEMNHLFQKTATGSVQEYQSNATTMEPEVLAEISGWIMQRFGTKASK